MKKQVTKKTSHRSHARTSLVGTEEAKGDGQNTRTHTHACSHAPRSWARTHETERGRTKILGQNAPRSWAQRRRRSRGTSRRPLCRPTPARAPRTATRGVILSGDLGVGVRWIMTAGVRFLGACVWWWCWCACVRVCVSINQWWWWWWWCDGRGGTPARDEARLIEGGSRAAAAGRQNQSIPADPTAPPGHAHKHVSVSQSGAHAPAHQKHAPS